MDGVKAINEREMAAEAVYFKQVRRIGRACMKRERNGPALSTDNRRAAPPHCCVHARHPLQPPSAVACNSKPPLSLINQTKPTPNQEDDKLLKGLLQKEQTKAGGDEAALREILGKYSVSDADIHAVLKWKGR